MIIEIQVIDELIEWNEGCFIMGINQPRGKNSVDSHAIRSENKTCKRWQFKAD